MTPEELLKEVGEPVGCHYLPNNEMFPVEEVSRSNLKNNPQDYVFLYTSDQLAAAILKATKLLEEEIRSREDFIAMLQETQKEKLAKAEQLWQVAQGRCDGLEEKLTKTEQLWQIAQGRCDGLEEKIAKAEQRVADACANYVNRFINGDGILNEVWISDIESALRNGEWRKHMKGD